MKQIKKFFTLFKGAFPGFKNLFAIIGLSIVVSLVVTTLSWFIFYILIGLKFDFLSFIRWSFFIFFGFTFIWDYVIIFFIRLIISYQYVKKFKTTPEKIAKIIKDPDLLKRLTNAQKNKKDFDFEQWFESRERIEKLANDFLKNIFTKG